MAVGSTGLSDEDFERAMSVVLGFLQREPSIKNASFRKVTGLNYDQAIKFFNRAVELEVLRRCGVGAGTHYKLPDGWPTD